MNHALAKFNFTPRQLDVARRVALGEPIKAIASNLKLSPRTVEDYLVRVRQKTGAETTAQAGCILARVFPTVKTRQ